MNYTKTHDLIVCTVYGVCDPSSWKVPERPRQNKESECEDRDRVENGKHDAK